MSLALTLLALQLAAAPPALAEPVVGKLCVRQAETPMPVERCGSVEGTVFSVEPSKEPRVFAWLRGDRQVLVLGYVEAGADRVGLPEEPKSISLRLQGSADRDWPQRTNLLAGPVGAPDRWHVELSAYESDRLREIQVPRGTREMLFKADRHALHSIARERLEELPVSLGSVHLEPLPQIRGLAIDREGEPVGAAIVLSLEDEVLATTDGSGLIEYEAPCSEEQACLLPEWFRVEYAGSAPRWFRVLNRRRDVNLGSVRLAPGGTLELRVDGRRTGGPLIVEIVEDRTAAAPPNVHPMTGYANAIGIFDRDMTSEEDEAMGLRRSFPVIASAELPRDESRIVFVDLPDGQLRVTLRGSRPGESLSRYFSVGPGETVELEMKIEPTVVTFKVTRGSEAIGGVPVEVNQMVPPFEKIQTMPTSRSGHTGLVLWEKGPHLALLADRADRAVSRFELGPDRSDEVRIDVTNAPIVGRVEDFDSGEAIEGARLVVQSLAYHGSSAFRAVTNDQGEFSIEDMPPDQYRVTLMAEGYPVQEWMVHGAPPDQNPVMIRIPRGLDYTIRLVWEDGAPIVDALYTEEGPFPFRAYSDERGEVRVTRAPEDQPRRFWVIPIEGSLAVSERGWEKEIVVEVDRPGHPLALSFEDEDGQPVDFAHVNFRWNYTHIPRAVRVALEQVQGRRFWSGASSRLMLEDMAPGPYTFWAISDKADTQYLPPHQPREVTSIHFSGAEQSATVVVPESSINLCVGPDCSDE